MQNIKPFGGGGSYVLAAADVEKDSDLINIEDLGHVSFCAKISSSSVTVTPTIYLYYGNSVGFGAAETLYDRNNSDATTFTGTFECSLNKHATWQACIGFKIRFSFSGHSGDEILTCDVVTSGLPK